MLTDSSSFDMIFLLEKVQGCYRVNPLEVDAVLIDEAAMLDLPLGAALLDALPIGKPCQLILVGAAPLLFLCLQQKAAVLNVIALPIQPAQSGPRSRPGVEASQSIHSDTTQSNQGRLSCLSFAPQRLPVVLHSDGLI